MARPPGAANFGHTPWRSKHSASLVERMFIIQVHLLSVGTDSLTSSAQCCLSDSSSLLRGPPLENIYEISERMPELCRPLFQIGISETYCEMNPKTCRFDDFS